MKRSLNAAGHHRLRWERRVRWRQWRQNALTIFWVALVVLGLALQRDLNDPAHDPALLGTVARTLPVRRRNKRQPNDVGASYARYSTELQDDNTIESQQDACHQRAHAESKSIASEFEFYDRAVSGTKLHRDGLDKLLTAAEAGLFSRLYFYSLSRLARESVIGMPILKRLVHVYRVRIISVTEGVDSDQQGWENFATILLMQHERYVKDLSDNCFRGQKANAANNLSNGDYCFGFTGEAVPGSESSRRGRHRKPRMRYVIEPTAAEWVRRIFHWFVVERRSLRWITRELNRLNAPKDHRSSKPGWHHQCLARLIANTKLIGLWPWGRLQNVRNPETGDVSQEERPSEESAQWLRRFPELRLIDDETFFKAQEILAENVRRNAHRHNNDGQFTEDQRGAALTNPAHLLSGLIVCGMCGRTFYVGGAHGRYLFCPNYSKGLCSCRTTLRRDVAERTILEVISARILNNPIWVHEILSCTVAAWRRIQASLPNDLRDTEAALSEVNRRVQRLLDLIEGNHAVEPDIQDRIAARRAEREQLESKLAQLRQSAKCVPVEPTLEWVTERIQDLREVLGSGTPAAAFALRDLVGGSVVVAEVRVDGRKRRYLRGTFQLQINSVLQAAQLGVRSIESHDAPGEPVTIDFTGPDPLAAKADQIKVLWDQGKLGTQIAAELGCSRAQVTKLLKHWATVHEVELPNGHARRQQIEQQMAPPFYQQTAGRAYQLMEQGLLIADIAIELDCDINTVRKAVQFWCESHDLPWIDGRTRRKELERKSRPRHAEDNGDDGGDAVDS